MRYDVDLLACIALAAGGAVVALAPESPAWLRVIIATPMVLFVPGYALTSALFPRRELGFAQRLLFSLGLSMVAVIVSGLGLNLTPWRLQTVSWAILLTGIAEAASLVALIRRHTAAQDQDAARPARPRQRMGFSRQQGVLAVLAVSVAVVAIGVAKWPLAPHGVQGYTSLWILPMESAGPRSILVGISSSELIPTSFHLEVVRDTQKLADWQALKLAPGQQWQSILVLPPNVQPGSLITAVLYRSDQPGVAYRQVKLWLTPKEGDK